MRNNIFVCVFFFFSFTSIVQFNNFKAEFSTTYNKHPNIPKGLLEAIAYNKTHLQNLEGTEQSCIGLPTYFGPMGIVKDGKNYFQNTADIITELSGYPKEDILKNPNINIVSYAIALENLTQN